MSKNNKINELKFQQIVLGVEVDFMCLRGLSNVLRTYQLAEVADFKSKRIIGWLDCGLRVAQRALKRGEVDPYGFLDSYKSFSFVNWFDVKDSILIKNDPEDSVFKSLFVNNGNNLTRRYPSLDPNKSIILALNSNEVRVLKDAISYCMLKDDFRELLNRKLFLVDLINDLYEVYQSLNGIALSEIFKVDLSLGITEGLSRSLNRWFIEELAKGNSKGSSEGKINKKITNLHIEKTPEGILEVEGFKLVGFYSFFK